MKNNPFYICKNYLIIYETKKIAALVGTSGYACSDFLPHGSSEETVIKEVTWMSKHFNSKITYSKPREPIFCLSERLDNRTYWNVIIGERIGWIIPKNWLGIVPLENVNGR